jgi:hypothetical protein
MKCQKGVALTHCKSPQTRMGVRCLTLLTDQNGGEGKKQNLHAKAKVIHEVKERAGRNSQKGAF